MLVHSPLPITNPFHRAARNAASTSERGLAFFAYKCATGFSVAFVQIAVYMTIGRADVARSTELLRTPFDDALPFLPWTSFFYLPCYLAVFVLALAAVPRRSDFHRALFAMGIVGGIAAILHALVPATYPRPGLEPPYANAGEWFMAFVQRIDPPSNVFPSLHVAHSTALTFVLLRTRRRAGHAAMVLTLLLTASTLTTKQHFVVDLLSGGLLGYAAAFIAMELGRARRP